VNDGCPQFGTQKELGCLNNADDDGDTVVNDGCPSSSMVANGAYHAAFTLDAICIGGTDADGDGWCAASTPAGSGYFYSYSRVTPGDVDNNNARVPEDYNVVFPFPIASSGTGGEPAQVCNDGVDDDGDGAVDLLDSGCKPSALAPVVDTDGDGFSDEAEVYIGTDPLGRCEVKGPGTSTDWPADVFGGPISTDKLTLQDLGAYTSSPKKLNTSPGNPNFDRRYDVVPGSQFGDWINLTDLNFLLGMKPPMFGGTTKAFNGPNCTAHPTLND